MRGLRWLRAVVVLSGWLISMPGCGSGTWRPEDQTGGAATTTGEGGGGAGGDGSDLFTTGDGGTSACNGVCVPSVPVPFERLTMFSIGAPDRVHSCAEIGSSVGFEGFADPEEGAYTCPTCACSPAACALPPSIHTSAATCADADGAPSTPFDPPPAWEGVCTWEGAIPAGLACDGAPCVQSVTLAAPAVDPCLPIEQGAPTAPPPPAWGTLARECLIDVTEPGCDLATSCVPAPPEGFTLCLFLTGNQPDYECPEDYPHSLVVHDTFDDTRGCEPCTCGPPEGAECETLVSLYKDGNCTSLIGTYLLTSDMTSACHDLPPGVALGSKDAHFTLDTPGTCLPAGGHPKGTLAPIGPVTLCCQSDPRPTG